MVNIKFRLAARCEAAGRPNNEDNYQVDENLSDNYWGFTADHELSLGEKGALLVVCDGMGGMNAGEVASAIAVNTIKEWFAVDRLTDKFLADDQSKLKYIAEAIQAADAAIKQDGQQNPEHEGMGSTIVLAWLLGQKVYVGWCGDSRAYRYNPHTGLVRLSRDHSYVQELVDAGRLTEELAFDHPNNNIITRSLGDPRGKAQPDTKAFDLCNEDIILLCSDGLCGCLRDKEIEAVIHDNHASMQQLRDALWQADEAAGWHDNVTIVLAQIISGAIASPVSVQSPINKSKAELLHKNRRLKYIICSLLTLLFLLGGIVSYKMLKNKNPQEPIEQTPVAENLDGTSVVVDSINSKKDTTAIATSSKGSNSKSQNKITQTRKEQTKHQVAKKGTTETIPQVETEPLPSVEQEQSNIQVQIVDTISNTGCSDSLTNEDATIPPVQLQSDSIMNNN